eukprot:CCRYP_015411-RD/>CCRYP_015411-RD protein AED:0.46 eAED:0.96 QI:0/0/0/1/0/0/3/0/111
MKRKIPISVWNQQWMYWEGGDVVKTTTLIGRSTTMFLMHCIHIPPTTLVKKQPNNILMSRSFPRQQMKRCGTQSIRHVLFGIRIIDAHGHAGIESYGSAYGVPLSGLDSMV